MEVSHNGSVVLGEKTRPHSGVGVYADDSRFNPLDERCQVEGGTLRLRGIFFGPGGFSCRLLRFPRLSKQGCTGSSGLRIGALGTRLVGFSMPTVKLREELQPPKLRQPANPEPKRLPRRAFHESAESADRDSAQPSVTKFAGVAGVEDGLSRSPAQPVARSGSAPGGRLRLPKAPGPPAQPVARSGWARQSVTCSSDKALFFRRACRRRATPFRTWDIAIAVPSSDPRNTTHDTPPPREVKYPSARRCRAAPGALPTAFLAG